MGSVGVLVLDADGEAERDFGLYRDLLRAGCWVVIDDYYSPKQEGKAVRIKLQVNVMVASGALLGRPLARIA